MSKVRVGIVGAGFAARFHYECLEAMGSAVEVVGCTSLREESRSKFGAERGIEAFDSLEAMLEQVDLVDICSPPYAHLDGIIDAAGMGKHIVCEKPLIGYFGPPDAGEGYRGDLDSKKPMFESVLKDLLKIRDAVDKSGVMFGYAENFVYAPSIQKEREIIEKTGAQILRMLGEESHNGSASDVYGIWRYAGGGSLIGKGCHPLSALLYLKRVEGLARDGKPLRPKSVTSRVHELTRLPSYQDKGFIRTDYHDIEDYGWMHVVFEDGTVGDVVTCEIVLGGIYDYVEVFANNHRCRCRLSPTDLLDVYNPQGSQFEDIYLVEKASTKEGWSPAAPDENWTLGYHAELKDFIQCACDGKSPEADLDLAIDTTSTIYAAYVSAEEDGKEQAIELL